MTSEKYNLTESLKQKVQILLSNIAHLQKEASANGASQQTVKSLCAPYFELVDRIYEEEFPLAKAIEESDLLLHLEGPAAK